MKNTERQIKKKLFYSKELNTNIDKVYSYGFGYGDADKAYIKYIISRINANATWFFTSFEAFNEDSVEEKKRKIREYGFKGNFDIYDG